jgi:hypothetical protein
MAELILPSSKLTGVIATSIARALFVSAYADHSEDVGKNAPAGSNWYDIAPATPAKAVLEAYRLIGAFEQINGASLLAIFNQACVANSVDFQKVPEKFAKDYGFYIAMSSLGHGVSWTDDHNDYSISGKDIKHPFRENEDYDFKMEELSCAP